MSNTADSVLTIYVYEGKNGLNIAEVETDGKLHEVKSRNSAVFNLCRDLASAGVVDCPFQAVSKTTGTIGYSGPSWRFLAGLTVVETDTHGPRLGKFKPMSEAAVKERKAGRPITDSQRGAEAPTAVSATGVAPHPYDAASDSRVTQETGVIDDPIPRREYDVSRYAAPPPLTAEAIAKRQLNAEADERTRLKIRAAMEEAMNRPHNRHNDKPTRLTCEAVDGPAPLQATKAPPGPATPCSLDTSPLEIDVTMKPALPLPFDAPGITLDDLLSA